MDRVSETNRQRKEGKEGRKGDTDRQREGGRQKDRQIDRGRE